MLDACLAALVNATSEQNTPLPHFKKPRSSTGSRGLWVRVGTKEDLRWGNQTRPFEETKGRY